MPSFDTNNAPSPPSETTTTSIPLWCSFNALFIISSLLFMLIPSYDINIV